MPHIFTTTKKIIITALTLVVILSPVASTVSFADEPAKCTPPPQSQAGVHWPTGSEAGMYTYQCDGQYSGLWLSAHYTFDPSNSVKTAIDPAPYTYNANTGKWDSSVWDYNAAKGAYVSDDISVATPPAGAVKIGGPAPVVTSPTSGNKNNGGTTNTAGVAGSNNSDPANGSNGINTVGNTNTNVNNNTGSSLNNGVLSYAGSGNAVVSGNTTGGSATSGNAQVIDTIINNLQSASNLGDPNTVYFTANINGDVNGDLLLDPTQLGAVRPADSSTALNNNVTVNNSTDASINNNIDLNAQTGDATVKNNTTGGNATSGNASAVANIVNAISSVVSAGQSFVGVININGNLNGDILLPPGFVDTLLANNVPHYSVSTSELNNNVSLNNNNNSTINNNVHAGATSGNASVAGNTGAGNATSGSANTDLTVFNLTGSTVVANNDLLVFVNDLGTWYGMIMNAPAGSTAASLGGGVTTNTVNNDAALNNNVNQTINNNINADAGTGNATVTGNTKGGDATSGDASSIVTLTNMINDKLTLNGWFGLLFINVYGTWNGSFGVNTSAGNPLAAPQSSGDGTSGPMFQFVPKSTTTVPAAANNTSTGGSNSGSASKSTNEAVLAAKSVKQTLTSAVNDPTLASTAQHSYLIPILGAGLALIILLGSERQRIFNRR